MKANEVIRQRRKELQLTLKEVAERAGVSEATVSRWESGDIKTLRRPNIEALSKILDISPAILMEWEEWVPSEQEEAPQYYVDDESRQMAEFFKNNKDYKVLFDAIRTVRPSDIQKVKDFIDEQNGNT